MTRIARVASVRLGTRSRNALLSVHITSTVSALGADLVILSLSLAGFAGSDPRTIYPATSLVAASVMAPFAIVSLATGVLLARLTAWGVFRYWWVTIKLVTTTGLVVLVQVVLVPRFSAAARAAGDGLVLTDAERLQLVVTSATGSGLLIAMIVLAVFKPSWRLPRRKVIAEPEPSRGRAPSR
jgi:hypothetical protein